MGRSGAELYLQQHITRLRQCRRCPRVAPPPVSGGAIVSEVMLIGQAPGVREPVLERPFAHTAGRTLFRWFEECCGLDEAAVRSRVYFAAVIRCFPGKAPRGGDRVPSREEIGNCTSWMETEFGILKPRLVIPVGKLAISQFIECDKLEFVVGRKFVIHRRDHVFDLVPLPHPSGASPWHKVSPGRELLAKAMNTISRLPAMKRIMKPDSPRKPI